MYLEHRSLGYLPYTEAMPLDKLCYDRVCRRLAVSWNSAVEHVYTAVILTVIEHVCTAVILIVIEHVLDQAVQ